MIKQIKMGKKVNNEEIIIISLTKAGLQCFLITNDKEKSNFLNYY